MAGWFVILAGLRKKRKIKKSKEWGAPTAAFGKKMGEDRF